MITRTYATLAIARTRMMASRAGVVTAAAAGNWPLRGLFCVPIASTQTHRRASYVQHLQLHNTKDVACHAPSSRGSSSSDASSVSWQNVAAVTSSLLAAAASAASLAYSEAESSKLAAKAAETISSATSGSASSGGGGSSGQGGPDPPFRLSERDMDLSVPLPSLRYPVVLVHGYLGYASLIRSPWPWGGGPLLEYFGSVRSHLGEASQGGITVLTPVNPPAASIAARAHKLRWALGLQSRGEQQEAAKKGKVVREKAVAGEHTERQVTGPNGNGNGNGVHGDPSLIEFANTGGKFDAVIHQSDSASPAVHQAEEQKAAQARETVSGSSGQEPSPRATSKQAPSSGTSIILGGQHINLDEYEGKFHLVAHSMGGLDCRYLIAQLQAAGEKNGDNQAAARRVASLTTVATPHRGSPVADLVLDVIDVPFSFRNDAAALAAAPTVNKISQRLAGWFGIDVSGITNLSTQAMRGFNERVRDAPGIVYQSYGGARHFAWYSVWYLPSKWVRDFARLHDHAKDGPDGLCPGGENDGLVSVTSARWGTYRGTTGLDHLEQIGLGVMHKHLPLYRQMVFRLKEIEDEEEERQKRGETPSAPGKEQAQRSSSKTVAESDRQSQS